MSKNYTMVQYVFPPNTLPGNTELKNAIFTVADAYIKAGKMPMGDSCVMYRSSAARDADNIPRIDYRISHTSNRFIPTTPGSLNMSTYWGQNVEQIFYRIFFNEADANEFIQTMLDYGALSARIIVEGGSTPELDFEYPDSVFAEESHVAQYVWPGYPNFDYQGTYPAAGPADATPWPEN